jgi:hypothetical protein
MINIVFFYLKICDLKPAKYNSVFSSSLVIFVLGKRLYIIKKPEGNVVLEVCKCIGVSISVISLMSE